MHNIKKMPFHLKRLSMPLALLLFAGLSLFSLISGRSYMEVLADACDDAAAGQHYEGPYYEQYCGRDWYFPCRGSCQTELGALCGANACFVKTDQLTLQECEDKLFSFPCYYTNIWTDPPCATCGDSGFTPPICGAEERAPNNLCSTSFGLDAACPVSSVPILDTNTSVTIEARGIINVPEDAGHVYGLMWFNSESSSNARMVELERVEVNNVFEGVYRKTFIPCSDYGKCYSGTANEMLWFDVWMSDDNLGSATFYCDDANFWITPPAASEDPPYASLAIENLTRSLYYSTADAVFINDNERVRVIGQGFSNPSSPDINQMNLRSCSSSQTCLDANSSTTVATSSTGIVETELSFSAGAVIRYLVNARNTTAAGANQWCVGYTDPGSFVKCVRNNLPNPSYKDLITLRINNSPHASLSATDIDTGTNYTNSSFTISQGTTLSFTANASDTYAGGNPGIVTGIYLKKCNDANNCSGLTQVSEVASCTSDSGVSTCSTQPSQYITFNTPGTYKFLVNAADNADPKAWCYSYPNYNYSALDAYKPCKRGSDTLPNVLTITVTAVNQAPTGSIETINCSLGGRVCDTDGDRNISVAPGNIISFQAVGQDDGGINYTRIAYCETANCASPTTLASASGAVAFFNRTFFPADIGKSYYFFVTADDNGSPTLSCSGNPSASTYCDRPSNTIDKYTVTVSAAPNALPEGTIQLGTSAPGTIQTLNLGDSGTIVANVTDSDGYINSSQIIYCPSGFNNCSPADGSGLILSTCGVNVSQCSIVYTFNTVGPAYFVVRATDDDSGVCSGQSAAAASRCDRSLPLDEDRLTVNVVNNTGTTESLTGITYNVSNVAACSNITTSPRLTSGAVQENLSATYINIPGIPYNGSWTDANGNFEISNIPIPANGDLCATGSFTDSVDSRYRYDLVCYSDGAAVQTLNTSSTCASNIMLPGNTSSNYFGYVKVDTYQEAWYRVIGGIVVSLDDISNTITNPYDSALAFLATRLSLTNVNVSAFSRGAFDVTDDKIAQPDANEGTSQRYFSNMPTELTFWDISFNFDPPAGTLDSPQPSGNNWEFAKDVYKISAASLNGILSSSPEQLTYNIDSKNLAIMYVTADSPTDVLVKRRLNTGTGKLMFIGSENVNFVFDSSVGVGCNSSTVNSIFKAAIITQGSVSFNTSGTNNDICIVVDGPLIAGVPDDSTTGSINLFRNRSAIIPDGNKIPTEQVRYNPQYIYLTDETTGIMVTDVIWEELE